MYGPAACWGAKIPHLRDSKIDLGHYDRCERQPNENFGGKLLLRADFPAVSNGITEKIISNMMIQWHNPKGVESVSLYSESFLVVRSKVKTYNRHGGQGFIRYK